MTPASKFHGLGDPLDFDYIDPVTAAQVLITIVLTGVVIFQQWFFLRQIKELVDRLMSRSYHEYVKAKEKPILKVELPKDEPVPDDLGPLNEFGAI